MEIIIASSLVGAVIGLICVAIFALTLRRVSRDNPGEAIKGLRRLIITILGGGLADYAIFNLMLKSNGLVWYMIGLGTIFLIFGVFTLVKWMQEP